MKWFIAISLSCMVILIDYGEDIVKLTRIIVHIANNNNDNIRPNNFTKCACLTVLNGLVKLSAAISEVIYNGSGLRRGKRPTC